MINQRFNLKPIKKVLIEVVRKTIVHFKISYLESDVKNKIITEEDLFFLESAVSNKIYYKLNSTFNEILIDVKLLQIGKVKNSVLLFINIFKLNFKLPNPISSSSLINSLIVTSCETFDSRFPIYILKILYF